MTGDVMSEYASDHMLPYLLAYGDTDVACATGQAMGSFLNSFERVTDPPHSAAIPTLVSAATCAQNTAWEADLRALRAIKEGRVNDAKDARVVEKIAHSVAARRLSEAYQRTISLYKDPADGCPSFDGSKEELVWLMGMLAGIQSAQHDQASGGAVGVALNIPVEAARGAACLNNSRWWGVPNALQGAIWATVPGSGPGGTDPWKVMEEAADLGDSMGIRLAHAVYLQAAASGGRNHLVPKLLPKIAAAFEMKKAPGQWKTLDRMAFLQAQNVSDRVWTESEGHRTPYGGLGDLPDSDDDDEDDDDDIEIVAPTGE